MKRFSAWTVIGLSCALGIPQSFVLLSSLVEPSNRSLDRWAVPLTLWGLPLFVVALGLSGGFAKQSIRDPFADFRQLVNSIARASMTPLTVSAIAFAVVGLGCSSYGLIVGSGQHEVVADQGEYFSITAGVKTPISEATFERKIAAVSWLYDGGGVAIHAMTILMCIASLGAMPRAGSAKYQS